jgi:hypothetical protein
LGLAAGKGGSGLPKAYIAQSDICQCLKFGLYLSDLAKKDERLAYSHLQHPGYVLPLVSDIERFPIVTLSLTHVTGHIDIREKVHFDLNDPISAARLAPSPLYIEAEAARSVPAGSCVPGLGEQVADVGKNAGVCGWVGARSSSDRRLVNVDYRIYVFKTGQPAVSADWFPGMIEVAGQRSIQGVDDQA